MGETAAGRGRLLTGTTSWADRSLVRDGGFYPRRSMSARERLAYYASRFTLTEVATTYRFPPTPAVTAQWVERTPPGFTFDVRAWSLLSGAPTLPDSLWPDLAGEVRPERRDRRRLYRDHLSEAALDECWARFRHALGPLVDAERLGVVVLQYPGWFTPRPQSYEELAALPARLPGVELAVELRAGAWTEGDACEATLELLEAHGLAFVCVDGPPQGPRALPPVVAATAQTAVVRFVGRRCDGDGAWTWPYRYAAEELAAWIPRVDALASSAREVHLIADNPWRADAVDAADWLARHCAEGEVPARR